MAELHFADIEDVEDLRNYVRRARSLDADGAIRLRSHGATLAAYVGVLPGHGLLTTGAVIGLRVMALAEPADVDVTVSLTSVRDRLAKAGASSLSVPPTTVQVGWAAMSPPQSGWEPVGELRVADLKTAAVKGIAEIAHAAPEGSGAVQIAALRQSVWARDSQTIPPVPSGAAFAAYALGFLGQDRARVFAHGRWTRLSTTTGHVLVC